MKTILVHETKSEHLVDRSRALLLWRLLEDHKLLPKPYSEPMVREHYRSDEDKLLALFEILEGGQLTELFFYDLASHDQGSTLIERGDEE